LRRDLGRDAAARAGLVEVRTCWFQIWLSLSARMRAVASFALPAAESTMIRTGLFG
jgi:hypothetical protein